MEFHKQSEHTVSEWTEDVLRLTIFTLPKHIPIDNKYGTSSGSA